MNTCTDSDIRFQHRSYSHAARRLPLTRPRSALIVADTPSRDGIIALVEGIRPLPVWNWLAAPDADTVRELADFLHELDLIVVAMAPNTAGAEAAGKLAYRAACPLWWIGLPAVHTATTPYAEDLKTTHVTAAPPALWQDIVEAPSRRIDSIALLPAIGPLPSPAFPDWGGKIVERAARHWTTTLIVESVAAYVAARAAGAMPRVAPFPNPWLETVAKCDAVISGDERLTMRAAAMLKPVIHVSDEVPDGLSDVPHVFPAELDEAVDVLRAVDVGAVAPAALNWKRAEAARTRATLAKLVDGLKP